jgi:hypothetical protein
MNTLTLRTSSFSATKVLAGLSIALSLGACAPTWVQVDKSNVALSGEGPGSKSSFKAPEGWLRIDQPIMSGLLMSKDGEGVQQIQMAQTTPERIFALSKIKVAAKTSPEDLAAAFQTHYKSSLGGGEVQSKSVTPIMLSGQSGFRSHFTMKDQKGAPREIVVVGAQRGNEVFYASYNALAIHYFQRDLPVFDQLVASIRLK